jgi:hypothetical protein
MKMAYSRVCSVHKSKVHLVRAQSERDGPAQPDAVSQSVSPFLHTCAALSDVVHEASSEQQRAVKLGMHESQAATAFDE